VVPDTISHFINNVAVAKKRFDVEDTLENTDGVFIYYITLIFVSDEFRERLKKGYLAVNKWKELMHNLRRAGGGNQGKLSKETYRFFIENNLIYYADLANERRRFYILFIIEKEIFKMTYNERNHAGFYRAYNAIVANFYIRNLSRRLKFYIVYYLSCGYFQITRHVSYGALYPVVSPSILFYTVTADFILALPKIKKGLNQIISLTCKYTKKVKLIPGKDIWFAEDWARAYYKKTTEWSLPACFIGDRDTKWLSDFWT
jgi:hypothetical protein